MNFSRVHRESDRRRRATEQEDQISPLKPRMREKCGALKLRFNEVLISSSISQPATNDIIAEQGCCCHTKNNKVPLLLDPELQHAAEEHERQTKHMCCWLAGKEGEETNNTVEMLWGDIQIIQAQGNTNPSKPHTVQLRCVRMEM